MPAIFEWHEAKRLANAAKHGIDFYDVTGLFERPHVSGRANTTDGEERRLLIGLLFGSYVTAIYTVRGNVIRLISARSARVGERRRYQQVFGVRVEADEETGRQPD